MENSVELDQRQLNMMPGMGEGVRGMRHTMPSKEAGLVYEFTRDPGYLHQYYILRTPLLNKTLEWQLKPEQDDYDKRAHTLIVRKGNLVVGGARIIVRSPRKDEPLSIEGSDFSLAEALPELNLANKKYCEFSRVALLEEYQGSKIFSEMFRRLYEKYRALNVNYGFSIAPRAIIRLHRRLAKEQGYNYTAFPEVDLPERLNEGVRLTLVMFDVNDSSSEVKTATGVPVVRSKIELAND